MDTTTLGDGLGRRRRRRKTMGAAPAVTLVGRRRRRGGHNKGKVCVRYKHTSGGKRCAKFGSKRRKRR